MKIKHLFILGLILIFKVNGLFTEDKEQTIDRLKYLVAHKLNRAYEFENSINGTLTDADSCLCKNGGKCEIIGNKTACVCPPKFAGVDCSLKDVCYQKAYCQNNGICKTKGINKFYCICPAPFRGLVCTELCDSKLCHYGGKCVDPKTSDKCVCEEGYYGDHCEFKDACYGTQLCLNGGTCTSPKHNRYKCICLPGFTGVNCQREICNPNPCLNDGICEVSGNNFTCECKEPHQGQICEINADETTENTQTNTDETTKSSPTSIDIDDSTAESTQVVIVVRILLIAKNETKICYCKKGKNEICIETCADSRECLNGGVCRIQEGRYGFCECQMNFGGDKCEINFLCAELEPTCKHIGAMCAYKNGIESCVCPPHKVYQLDSGICKDICDEKSCLNGQCINSKNSSTCRCHMGYTGVKCDIKMSEHKYLLVIIFVLLAFILISFIIGSISFSWILWRLRSRSENQQERI